MRNNPTILKILLIAVATAGATIYKWVDEQGVTQYSDTPQKNSKSQPLEIESERPPASPETENRLPTESWREKADAFRERHQARQQQLEDELKKQRYDAEQAAIRRGERTPVGGESVATPPLQQDVMSTIVMLDSAKAPDCANHKILDTELIERSRRPRQYVERWTVDRCGQAVRYRVTFTPNPRGGTDFSVQAE